MAKNEVIAGDYKGCSVKIKDGVAVIGESGFLGRTFRTINKNSVVEYEVITEESRKSAKSAGGRALVGSILLGGVGLLAGLSAKSKGTYTIAIQFRQNDKALIEVDDKIYKAIIKECF